MVVERRREYAEDKYILHRLDNPKGNYGTDLAAIAYMNRLDPEHWNRNQKLQLDVPNELLQSLRELKELAARAKDSSALPETKVIDGEARALPWE